MSTPSLIYGPRAITHAHNCVTTRVHTQSHTHTHARARTQSQTYLATRKYHTVRWLQRFLYTHRKVLYTWMATEIPLQPPENIILLGGYRDLSIAIFTLFSSLLCVKVVLYFSSKIIQPIGIQYHKLLFSLLKLVSRAQRY